MSIPRLRVHPANQRPLRVDGRYVLYWMTANRRAGWNFALEHAADTAARLGRPLVVLEALRCDYPFASDRLHRFILQGMADNRRRFLSTSATYHPFVERGRGEGSGLVEALSVHACAVVTDVFPAFFLPRMVAAAARRIDVSVEAVDSCGVLPLSAPETTFPLAHSFRRYLQKNLAPHLRAFPKPDPLVGLDLPRLRALPAGIVERYPAAPHALLEAGADVLGELPIDHRVAAAPVSGGCSAAALALRRFVSSRLARYDEDRNHPDLDGASGLSPWLHFGHLSAHEAVRAVLDHEGWDESRLAEKASGSRAGWWGVSAPAEAFLDQLTTWRELGFNMAFHQARCTEYESLPPWARATLEKHASDPREHVYDLDALASSATHDRVWNAAQTQLRQDGRLHNYLRMLWGKRILEWARHPREALDVMTELNDRYALDGRDPNSTSGIFWVMGRYDRAWGPERRIFGTVRYMSSANTVRKVRMARYLERYGDGR